MIGSVSGMAIFALFLKVAVIVGAIVAVIMIVRALRRSAREQARIADQLERLQQVLESRRES